MSQDETTWDDTAAFNAIVTPQCVELEPGRLTKLTTVNTNVFVENSTYYIHYYLIDAAGNLGRPRVSGAMRADLTAPSNLSFDAVNEGPDRQVILRAKFSEISHHYYAVYPLTVSGNALSADSVVKGLGALRSYMDYQYSPTSTIQWIIGDLPDGDYRIAVVAEDLVGNRSELKLAGMHVDATAPVLGSLRLTENLQMVGVPSEEGTLFMRLRLASDDASTAGDFSGSGYSGFGGQWLTQAACNPSGFNFLCKDGKDYVLDVIYSDNSGDFDGSIGDDNVSPVYSLPFTYDETAKGGPDTLYVDVRPTERGVSAAFRLDEDNAYAAIAVVPNTGSPWSTVGEFRDMVVVG